MSDAKVEGGEGGEEQGGNGVPDMRRMDHLGKIWGEKWG